MFLYEEALDSIAGFIADLSDCNSQNMFSHSDRQVSSGIGRRKIFFCRASVFTNRPHIRKALFRYQP